MKCRPSDFGRARKEIFLFLPPWHSLNYSRLAELLEEKLQEGLMIEVTARESSPIFTACSQHQNMRIITKSERGESFYGYVVDDDIAVRYLSFRGFFIRAWNDIGSI